MDIHTGFLRQRGFGGMDYHRGLLRQKGFGVGSLIKLGAPLVSNVLAPVIADLAKKIKSNRKGIRKRCFKICSAQEL